MPSLLIFRSITRKPVISESEERQRMSDLPRIMPEFSQSIPSSSSQPIETVEQVSEVDLIIAKESRKKCKRILRDYEKQKNLDRIIFSLTRDTSTVIFRRHEVFVKSMTLITLDCSQIIRPRLVGKMFTLLLSRKILSMEDITRGLNAALKDWIEHLIDYPKFFSYIAAIIAPLLLARIDIFDFNNLKDSCTSIRPDNSSTLFTEVLNRFLCYYAKSTTQNKLDGIYRIYKKWKTSGYVPLGVFMPDNQINKYIKNDQTGIFLTFLAMYDIMKLADFNLLYDELQSWITVNISEEIIKHPQFMLALSTAIVIVCSKSEYVCKDDFFNHDDVKLLTYYIHWKSLSEPEIQAREVQCLYGIQIMCAVLEHPGRLVPDLFGKLYDNRVISIKSFELWRNECKSRASFYRDIRTNFLSTLHLYTYVNILIARADFEEEETAE